jgi:hypothetical protein
MTIAQEDDEEQNRPFGTTTPQKKTKQDNNFLTVPKDDNSRDLNNTDSQVKEVHLISAGKSEHYAKVNSDSMF